MPINKNAFGRYRIIDDCLRNDRNRYPTKSTLLDRLGNQGYNISSSMLDKDMRYMKDTCGAPIEYDRTRKGYCYSDPDYSFRGIGLTEEEKKALELSASIIENLRFIPIYDKYKAAINKLVGDFRAGKTFAQADPVYIQVEAPLSGSGSEWFELLYEAIAEYKRLNITYQKFGKPPTRHSLSPYLLKEYHHYWYVIGHSAERNSVLVFALNRITDIGPAKEKYIFPANFSPEDYFKYSLGATHYHGEKPQKIRLTFYGNASDYITSMPLHHSQKEIRRSAKELVIELNVYITPELKSTILSYGSNVKVLAPDTLAKEIKDEIQKSQSRYV